MQPSKFGGGLENLHCENTYPCLWRKTPSLEVAFSGSLYIMLALEVAFLKYMLQVQMKCTLLNVQHSCCNFENLLGIRDSSVKTADRMARATKATAEVHVQLKQLRVFSMN